MAAPGPVPDDPVMTPAPSARVTTDATAEPARRVAWADVAKGLCILLVVLHHVVGKHLPLVVPDTAAGAAVVQAWVAVDTALKPVRMPLFFAVSGMFAAGALRRPWPLVAVRRVLTPYWTYLVWLAVHVVVFATVATAIETHRVPGVLEGLTHLLLAATGVWYLYALAVYFVVAKLLLAHVIPGAAVAGAAVVSLLASWLPIEGVNRYSVVHCFVFFLAGACFPRLLAGLPRLRLPGVAALLTAYAATAAACLALGAPKSVFSLALAPVAVVLGVQLAMAVSDRGWAGGRAAGPVAALGRRTLPVYVLHMPLLGVLHQWLVDAVYANPDHGGAVLTALRGGAALPSGAEPRTPYLSGGVPAVVPGGGAARDGGAELLVALAWAGYPLLLVAGLVAASLLTHRALLRLGAGWMFDLPAAVRERAQRGPRLSAR